MVKHLLIFTYLSSLSLFSMNATLQPVVLTGPTYRDVRIQEGYKTVMPTTGDIKMLVIPINFSDASCDLIIEGCEQTRQNINQAFFGEASTMRWHSVASYYRLSSYNQLRIDGMVTNWFTPSITAVALSENRGLLGSQVIQPALEKFKLDHANAVTDYDQDQDGFLDAVYFIYSLPFDPQEEIYGEDKDVFWAFVAYQGGQANLANPSLFHYGWSSYQFMYEDGTYQRSDNGKVIWDDNDEPIFLPHLDLFGQRQVDAHVFIHEVGHLLGLQDYYTYDRDAGDWGPSGALDMMDYNLGDHNGFSKMALGWVQPYVANRLIQSVTLPALSETPRILILPKATLTTMMDEYILIEFYQPTGLNQKDSQEAYAGRYPRMFTQPGIKIYHIDARIAQLIVTSQGLRLNGFVTNMQTSGYRYQIAHNNTVSRNATGTNPNHKLIHLLEASGINTFRHGGFATNATLFQTGAIWNTDTNPYLMNDGTRLPWELTIGVISQDGVQLSWRFIA
ncbi:MAG: hypothetical protein FJ352_03460 [Firmicutes bacterium]|nr:hypothetical protein [Bacillota bacterium]